MNNAAVTLFTTCKPFQGEAALAQNNALCSWSRLGLPIRVFGDEAGVSEACLEYGATQVSDIQCNAHGTPLLNDLFAKARQYSHTPYLCYLNADIILRDDFIATLQSLLPQLVNAGPTLIVARRTNVPLLEPLAANADFNPLLDRLINAYGSLDRANAADMFVFHRDLFTDVPALAVGRMQWDNWLLWHAHHSAAQVVDTTGAISVIHPLHSYSSPAGGWAQVTQGEEAQQNRQHCGDRLMNIDEASTHRFRQGKLVPKSAVDDATVQGDVDNSRALSGAIHYLIGGLETRSVEATLDGLRNILWNHDRFFPVNTNSACITRDSLQQALQDAGQWLVDGNYEHSLETLQNLLVNDLVQRAGQLQRRGRPLVIWGAGGLGLRLQALFDRLRIPFIGFLDSNHALLHATVNGKPVVANSWLELDRQNTARPFVFIASMYHREIAAHLQASGLVAEQDYVA